MSDFFHQVIVEFLYGVKSWVKNYRIVFTLCTRRVDGLACLMLMEVVVMWSLENVYISSQDNRDVMRWMR